MSKIIRSIYDGTMPVPLNQSFDVKRLEEYLKINLPSFEKITEIQQFKGGQSNPTYLISSGTMHYVLRRRPFGNLLPSAHAIDREYGVISALQHSDVPVAKPKLLCEDESVIGSSFYIIEYVRGRVFWEPSLSSLEREERTLIYGEAVRVIAALHNTDFYSVGLTSFGSHSDYFKRQISRWTKQYRASETENIDAMEKLIGWLPNNVPQDGALCLVHGDYKIDNLIFHPSEPKVLAVLDWELSTLGHPLADFAYHCLPWYLGRDELRGIVDEDLDDLQIPTVKAHLEAYCLATGRPAVEPQLWQACIAFAMFKVAAILQGVMKRAIDGSASNAHALQAGCRARAIAQRGWQLAQSRHYFY